MADAQHTQTPGLDPGLRGLPGLADRTLTFVETALLAFAFLVMIGVMFGQGVLSGLLGFEWPWARKLALNMMVLAVGAGASVAVRERRHVAIDALVRLLPPRARAALAAIVAVLCAAACLTLMHSALAYLALYQTELSHMDLRIMGLRIPLWTTRLALPFTLILLAARFLLVSYEEMRAALQARGRGEAP